jgi:hypothetical protein
MNPFLANVLGFAGLLAFLGALMRWPRVIGGTAVLVLTTAGCAAASQGLTNRAVTAFFYSVLFGIVALACAPTARKGSAP